MGEKRVSLHFTESDTTSPLSSLSWRNANVSARPILSATAPYLDRLSRQRINWPCCSDLELVVDHVS